jgi:hypothetical protein
VAQAKLLVYCQGAVPAKNRLKPTRNTWSLVFLLSFLGLMLSTPVYYGKQGGPAQLPKWAKYGRAEISHADTIPFRVMLEVAMKCRRDTDG